MTSEERKSKKREYMRRYSKSDTGKAVRAAYMCSDEFKAYRAGYSRSDEFKKSKATWANSEKGRMTIRAQDKSLAAIQAHAKYHSSDKGKATALANRSIPENKKRISAYGKACAKTPAGKWKEYRCNAAARNLLFDLTFEQFMTFWQKPCHYCGDPIATVGLDRMDNTQGYTVENTVPCCRPHNIAKMQMTVMEFVASCAKVVRKFEGAQCQR